MIFKLRKEDIFSIYLCIIFMITFSLSLSQGKTMILMMISTSIVMIITKDCYGLGSDMGLINEKSPNELAISFVS